MVQVHGGRTGDCIQEKLLATEQLHTYIDVGESGEERVTLSQRVADYVALYLEIEQIHRSACHTESSFLLLSSILTKNFWVMLVGTRYVWVSVA